MVDQLKTALRWISARVIVFYAIIFMVMSLSLNHVRLMTKITNRYAPPSMDYLCDLAEEKVAPDPKVLKTYRRYFEIMSRYIAPSPFGYGMMGFTSYYMGEVKKAARYYKKALVLYPPYLVFNYNLAVISLKENDLAQAVSLLGQSLQTIAPSQNYMLVNFSLMELQSFRVANDLDEKELSVKVRKDYIDATFFLAASLVYLNKQGQLTHLISQLIGPGAKEDPRLSCIQKYISASQDANSRIAGETFEVCRKGMGWDVFSDGADLQRDPFHLRALRLKIM